MSSDSRRVKFITLAERRTNSAIKNIRLIGNLSNKSNYSYSLQDAQKIYTTLSNEIKNMKARFDDGGKANQPDFKL